MATFLIFRVHLSAHWKDLLAQFGNWKSVHKRFTRWTRSGIWQRIFQVPLDYLDKRYVLIDSTIVRAHQQAASGRVPSARVRCGIGSSATV